MIRQPPRSTPLYSSAASDVYKRQAQKEPEGMRYRLFSIGTQSNLLLEVGTDNGVRVLLSTKMEPLVERLRGSGEIVLDDSRDFTLSKDEAVKFVIERRGEPYWWAYKIGSPTAVSYIHLTLP